MTREEVEAIVAIARQAWIEGDGDRFANLFLPEGEFIAPGYKWVGKDEIRQVLIDYSLSHSEVKIDIKQVVVDGNFAVVEWYWEETKNATGKRNRADDAIAIDFQDGLISRWREYIDSKTWMQKKLMRDCAPPTSSLD